MTPTRREFLRGGVATAVSATLLSSTRAPRELSVEEPKWAEVELGSYQMLTEKGWLLDIYMDYDLDSYAIIIRDNEGLLVNCSSDEYLYDEDIADKYLGVGSHVIQLWNFGLEDVKRASIIEYHHILAALA